MLIIFIYLLPIYISSLENCLPGSLPGLLTGLFAFLVFDVFSSLHILEITPLPNEQMLSDFPRSVGCLVTLFLFLVWGVFFALI